MFVNDCCINSSFHLPIVLFSIAPAMFTVCTNLRRNGGGDRCIVGPQSLTSDRSFLFDTRAIVDISQSGPCQLHQRAYIARFYKVVQQQSTQIFFCRYNNIINDSRKVCRDSGKVKVRHQVASPGDRDAFNFNLELVNVQPTDFGSYRYEAIFYIVGDTNHRVLTRHFQAINCEYNVYLCCLFLKVMINGE